MHFPEFFDAAPRLAVRDPLAGLLGAAEGGVIEYSYGDVVKLAGHSCPTVASAYLMTRAALRSLYPGALPERGGIQVELREDRREGVTGVVANVVSYLTGATHDTGFKGIAGHFDRRNLLFFDVDLPGQIRFTRVDSGATVTASARLDRVPADPRTRGWPCSCNAASPAPPRLTKRSASNRCGKTGSGPCSSTAPTIRTRSSFNTEDISVKIRTCPSIGTYAARRHHSTEEHDHESSHQHSRSLHRRTFRLGGSRIGALRHAGWTGSLRRA